MWSFTYTQQDGVTNNYIYQYNEGIEPTGLSDFVSTITVPEYYYPNKPLVTYSNNQFNFKYAKNEISNMIQKIQKMLVKYSYEIKNVTITQYLYEIYFPSNKDPVIELDKLIYENIELNQINDMKKYKIGDPTEINVDSILKLDYNKIVESINLDNFIFNINEIKNDKQFNFIYDIKNSSKKIIKLQDIQSDILDKKNPMQGSGVKFVDKETNYDILQYRVEKVKEGHYIYFYNYEMTDKKINNGIETSGFLNTSTSFPGNAVFKNKHYKEFYKNLELNGINYSNIFIPDDKTVLDDENSMFAHFYLGPYIPKYPVTDIIQGELKIVNNKQYYLDIKITYFSYISLVNKIFYNFGLYDKTNDILKKNNSDDYINKEIKIIMTKLSTEDGITNDNINSYNNTIKEFKKIFVKRQIKNTYCCI